MKSMIAYCGLVCTDCSAYIATQKNDMEGLKEIAARWGEELNLALAWEDCRCDGCRAVTGRQIAYCRECQVRACAISRGMENCAHCPDYTCAKLEGVFGFAPEAKAKLEEIRQTLEGKG
jgi:hypothetical protein